MPRVAPPTGPKRIRSSSGTAHPNTRTRQRPCAALSQVFTPPEPVGVVIGLVAGKALGIFLGTCLAARFTRAQLNPGLAWADVFGLSALPGIGFTVALLIGKLALPGSATGEHVKAAVLVGSLLSAALAAVLLRRSNVICLRLSEEQNLDTDADGIPDIYQRSATAAERQGGQTG